jgi:cell division control protein 45
VIGAKIEGYYTHNFFGYPSSYSAYRLVRDLSKANNDYLWYGVVGMTSMYLERKLGKEALETLSEAYKLDVLRFNSTGQGRRDRGDMVAKRAYHFPLLDHWSLYDSMLHSHYLTTKLALWEDRGLTRLHEFIHTLGISLHEAKQLYKYMPLDSQRKIDSSIFPAAEKFGLHEVTFMSFARHIDCSASLMASDYYCILTSVLENAPSGLGYEELYDHRVKSFWQAYDLLEGSYK